MVLSLSFLCDKSAIRKSAHFFAHFCTFAHFWRATKFAIAPLHIFIEQINVRLHISTFSKSKNVRCANERLPTLNRTLQSQLLLTSKLYSPNIYLNWFWFKICSHLILKRTMKMTTSILQLLLFLDLQKIFNFLTIICQQHSTSQLFYKKHSLKIGIWFILIQ